MVNPNIGVNPDSVVESVTFRPDFDTDALHYNDKLGFLTVDEGIVSFGAIQTLGFGAPHYPRGGIDTRPILRSITEYSKLPPDAQTMSLQGKGVGTRLYNNPNAIRGLPTEPDFVGAYTVSLDPARILDLREADGGRISQIRHHAQRVIMAKLTSPEAVIDKIHASYGDAAAVLRIQPAKPAALQALRGAPNPANMPGEFLIIRDPEVIIRRVGRVAVD